MLEGSKLVECKWVFKTKYDSKDNIEWYKAWLVAKGFTQKDRALVAYFDLELHQIDAKTAFLKGDFEEEIYINFDLRLISWKWGKYGIKA